MVYLGSKNKISKFLIPILQRIIDENNIKVYWEPFGGGGNVIDKIKCKKKIASDLSPTLIALLQMAQTDFDKIPKECTKEKFDEAKILYRSENWDVIPLYEIGAYEWLGSYGAKGFQGSFAREKNGRNYYKERYNNLFRQSPDLRGIDFQCLDYRNFSPPPLSLIYCDPPYQNTLGYEINKNNPFDHKVFWDWVREKSKECFVICSEETAPNDFIVVDELEKRREVGIKNDKKSKEKLFIYSKGLLNGVM